MDFISQWKEHPAGSTRRQNLEESDKVFEDAYVEIKPDDDEYVEPGTLLYRVHHRMVSKPNRQDFSSTENYQSEVDYANKMNGDGKIDFDNHWVSFTKNPEVIVKSYFKNKGLSGDVIVIKSEKAIDISEIYSLSSEEEVVAPLNKKNLIEILTSENFEKKYIS